MKDPLESIERLFPLFAQNAAAALAAISAALLVFLIVKRWKDISRPGGGRVVFLSVLALLLAGAIVNFAFAPSVSPDLSGTVTGFYEREGNGFKSTVRGVSIRSGNETGFHRVSYDDPRPFIEWYNKLHRAVLWGNHDCAHLVLGVDGKLNKTSESQFYQLKVPLSKAFYKNMEFLSGLQVDVEVTEGVPTALVKVGSTGEQFRLEPPSQEGRPRHPIAKCDSGAAAREERRGSLLDLLVGTAFAQARFDTAAAEESLKSSDSRRRAEARRVLAKNIGANRAALAWAQDVVLSRDSGPPELAANAIQALTEADIDAAAISADVQRRILELVADESASIRSAAVDFLRLRRTYDQSALDQLVGGLNDPSRPRQQADRFGAALAALYYHRGVLQFEEYFEKDKAEPYARAVQEFNAGLGYLERVSPEQQYRFALLHWGLAISRYVRFWRLPDPQRAGSPLKTETLKSLEALVRLTKGRPYTYPYHARAAAACAGEGGWSETCLGIKIR